MNPIVEVGMKKIDCHVHFVGGGTAQSGTWFTLKTWWDRLQARMMLKGCGIEASAMHDDLDDAMPARLGLAGVGHKRHTASKSGVPQI